MESTETLAQIEREAKERLNPSLSNPNWLVLSKRREILRRWLSRLPQRNMCVLDVGGRLQPYRPLLEDRVNYYIALDPRYTPLVDVLGRGEQMPFATGMFDFVICTQMLEYSPEPTQVISEIHRVLKPGGCLFLSVPSIAPRDSESDAWRFLPCSLRMLLEGFREAEIVREGGSIAGFFRSINAGLVLLARPRVLGTLLRFTVVPVLNLAAASIEYWFTVSDDTFSANFSAWAQK
jgi:SAM-dependent methyltransferase